MLGGGTTRNAVIGKAHRLKLAARATSKQSRIPKRQNITANSVPNKQEGYISRKSRFKSLLLDKNFEVENPKKLEELSNKNCRWPIGHPDEENFYFCGRSPVDNFSYCKLHVLYAFQPKNQKEELIDKEDDIPAFIEKKVKAAK
jgi:GcrA cell cycle regulator